MPACTAYRRCCGIGWWMVAIQRAIHCCSVWYRRMGGPGRACALPNPQNFEKGQFHLLPASPPRPSPAPPPRPGRPQKQCPNHAVPCALWHGGHLVDTQQANLIEFRGNGPVPVGGGGGALAAQPPSHPASHLVTQPPNRTATILCWALHFCILPLCLCSQDYMMMMCLCCRYWYDFLTMHLCLSCFCN